MRLPPLLSPCFWRGRSRWGKRLQRLLIRPRLRLCSKRRPLLLTRSPHPHSRRLRFKPAARSTARVKDGNVPLPGVSVTASNSLTGKRYSTTTDVTGSYTLMIPQNGRFVLRTELAAFAPATKEALLNATAHEQTIDFAMELASRASSSRISRS